MHLMNNIKTLAACDGVLAVLVDSPNMTTQLEGDASWLTSMTKTMDILRDRAVEHFNVVLPDCVISAYQCGSESCVVVLPKGHPFCKSLARTVRRYSARIAKARKVEQAQPTEAAA